MNIFGKNIIQRNIKSVLILLLLIAFYSLYVFLDKNKLHEEINNYKGDGVIQFLEAPSVLGSYGCTIDMQQIDLSKKFKKEYDLATIPTLSHYLIYFIITDEQIKAGTSDQIFKGEVNIEIKKNNQVTKKFSSTLGNMTNMRSSGVNHFYFFPDGFFDVKNYTDMWSVEFSYENSSLTKPSYGHLQLRNGGYQ